MVISPAMAQRILKRRSSTICARRGCASTISMPTAPSFPRLGRRLLSQPSGNVGAISLVSRIQCASFSDPHSGSMTGESSRRRLRNYSTTRPTGGSARAHGRRDSAGSGCIVRKPVFTERDRDVYIRQQWVAETWRNEPITSRRERIQVRRRIEKSCVRGVARAH